MPRRRSGRLSRKSSKPLRFQKKRHYVTKYFDVTPAGFPMSWRVIARTGADAKEVFKALMRKHFKWSAQSWKEFSERELRLAKVERWISPVELKRMGAGGEQVAKVKTQG